MILCLDFMIVSWFNLGSVYYYETAIYQDC